MSTKKKKKSATLPADVDRCRIGTLFMDSGAHSIWNKYVGNIQNFQGYEEYDKQPFWDYVDGYAEWIKKQGPAVDYYASVDVIYDPKRSWKVLKYLEEKHGLKPVPVLHWNADLKWLDKHLEEGYTFIGFGGLGQGVTKDGYYAWADRMFTRLCPAPSYLPIARIHGFAMTSYELLLRYPWWSVDSASWVKSGGFGMVMAPHKRNGKFTFDTKPYTIITSADSKSHTNNEEAKHWSSCSGKDKEIILEWLKFIDIPLGSVDAKGELVEWGVVSHHAARKIANLKFFMMMCKALPEWPWPYKPKPTMGRLPCLMLGATK